MSKSAQYFRKFPVTPYKGVPSLNIMKRTDFDSSVRGFLSVFYNYTMNEGDKYESLAFDYYDDVDYDWIIHHVNGTVDPYYQPSLSQQVFDDFIRKKYGSIRLASQRIAFFENNFREDDRILSPQDFQQLAETSVGEIKYWRPVENAIGIIAYERHDDPFRSSTNIIISFDFDEAEKPFEVGELVKKQDDDTAFAEVVWSSTTSCTVQHVRGDFTQGTVVGDQSKLSVLITEATVSNVIPIDEQKYYKAVSFYDLESQENEDRREIFLIDRTYADQLNKQLNQLLR